jgi:hypothetical protein
MHDKRMNEEFNHIGNGDQGQGTGVVVRKQSVMKTTLIPDPQSPIPTPAIYPWTGQLFFWFPCMRLSWDKEANT